MNNAEATFGGSVASGRRLSRMALSTDWAVRLRLSGLSPVETAEEREYDQSGFPAQGLCYRRGDGAWTSDHCLVVVKRKRKMEPGRNRAFACSRRSERRAWDL